MATLAEHIAALEARSDVVAVSTPFPPQSNGAIFDAQGNVDAAKVLAHDQPRLWLGTAVRRRVEVIRQDAGSGDGRIYYEDFGVYDLGGPGETVIKYGAGPASEPPNPEDIFKAQAEVWIAANVGSVDANIVKWWITRVDEVNLIAWVMTIYDDGAGGFIEKPFIALKPNGAVQMRPDMTVR